MSRDTTELPILEIKKKTILYDKGRRDFKDTTKKKDVWKEIAKRVGLNEKEAETHWKNVKDGLAESRRKSKTKSGYGAKNVKMYKYAKIMDFLVHFKAIDNSDAETQPPEEEEVDFDLNHDTRDDDDDNSEPESPSPPPPRDAQPGTSTPATSVSKQSQKTKCERKRCRDEVDKTLCEYLKNKSSARVKMTTPEKMQQKPFDDLDLFMQSMAGTIRKLPGRQCSEV
ncbi:uncharacterized protein LOC135496515 [Lineus longissimus]|uniref:uncharacterized protein LOC135496515 n=1 Tax=Lineus longissimus TaxID=88925 RepID=UPI00315D768E